MADTDTKSIAERRRELSAKYDELESTRRALRLDFLPMKREMDDIEGEVAYYTEKLEEYEKKIEVLQAKIDEHRSTDDALENQQMEIDDELDLLKEVGN